jgi:DNA-binding transcriptional MerR regulator
MPTEYSLQELAKLSGLTPRTIRFYIENGLLAAPTALGPKARYTDEHLDRLRVIRRLQAAHLPLAEIRNRLRELPADALTALAADQTSQPADSAIDYINRLLRPTPPPASMPASMPAPPSVPPLASMPAAVPERTMLRRVAEPEPAQPVQNAQPAENAAKPNEPERAQWERISLDPDIEIHIRRPLTRQQNKRVERLISIARQLLEE